MSTTLRVILIISILTNFFAMLYFFGIAQPLNAIINIGAILVCTKWLSDAARWGRP